MRWSQVTYDLWHPFRMTHCVTQWSMAYYLFLDTLFIIHKHKTIHPSAPESINIFIMLWILVAIFFTNLNFVADMGRSLVLNMKFSDNRACWCSNKTINLLKLNSDNPPACCPLPPSPCAWSAPINLTWKMEILSNSVLKMYKKKKTLFCYLRQSFNVQLCKSLLWETGIRKVQSPQKYLYMEAEWHKTTRFRILSFCQCKRDLTVYTFNWLFTFLLCLI